MFENTYDVDEITLAETDFASYEKQFDRWDIADKFRIELIPTTEGLRFRMELLMVKRR